MFFDNEDKEVDDIFFNIGRGGRGGGLEDEGEADEEVGRGQGGSGHLHRVGQHPLCGVH